MPRPSDALASRIRELRSAPDSGGDNAFWSARTLLLLECVHELCLAAESSPDPSLLALATATPWTLAGFEALCSAFPIPAAQSWLDSLPGRGHSPKIASEQHGYAAIGALGSDWDWTLWESYFRNLAIQAETQAILDACPAASAEGFEFRL